MKAIPLILLLLCGIAQGGQVQLGNPSPTFDGYKSIVDIIAGYVVTPASNGDWDSLTAYILKGAGTTTMKGAILLASDGSLVAQTAEVTPSHSEYAWVSMPIVGRGSVSAGVDYVIVVWANEESPITRLLTLFDAGEVLWTKSETYGSWPNPVIDPITDTKKGCMYATYTESDGSNRKLGIHQ